MSKAVLETLHQKELARWYKLKDHPVQLSLINDSVRFKVVPAGRRSGKTERAKRFVAREAMRNPGSQYFLASPTREQTKRIFWADMKLFCFAKALGKRAISESDLIITLPNASTISLIGLDKPERFEGVPWDGGVIDEVDELKSDAWPLNISPALDTVNPLKPDHRAWCWLIGVPDGLELLYDRAEYAKAANDPSWRLYHWKSSEILPPDVIEAAKKRMSAKQYRQEYDASFETVTGRIYEDYGKDNLTNETIAPHEQLLWTHDFNYTPLSSGIAVNRGDDLYFLDEIVLESAVSRQSALEFCDKFKDHGNKNVIIFGDPSGKAGEKHGHASDYTEIEDELRRNGWKMTRRVKIQAPAIKDRQNSVRRKIKTAYGEVSLYVNPDKAKYCHEGLSRVAVKKGSTFLEEDSEFQHITTAIGYLCDQLYPIRTEKQKEQFTPIPTAHHWRELV